MNRFVKCMGTPISFCKLAVLVALLGWIAPVSAQVSEATETVTERWYSLRLKKKINKDWDILLRTEARSLPGNDQYLIEPAIKYDLAKRLSLTATYRLSLEDKKNGIDYRSRVDIDLKYTHKIKPLELSARLMYSDVLDDQGFGAGRNRLRSRMEAELPLMGGRLKPAIGAELFYSFDLSALERLRYIASLSYDITDPMALFISFRQEDYYEEPLINKVYLVGLKFKI